MSARALSNAHRVSPPDDPDFYPTPIWGARAGAELVMRLDPQARTVWEPACGAGHMVHGLRDYFVCPLASDAYPYDGNAIFDFVNSPPPGPGWPLGTWRVDWVMTNPPFAHAEAFIRRSWAVARRGVALLMRAAALETIGRHPLLYADCPLTVFAPFSERLPMTKGRWEPDASSAAFYAWFLFLKPALRPQRFMARVGDQLLPAVLPIAPGTAERLTHPDDAGLFGAVDRSKPLLIQNGA